MPWGKMDDKFHRNRKVRALRKLGARGREALGVWTYWWSWCLDAGGEFDGYVPRDELKGSDLKSADILVEIKLWIETSDGYFFKDFNEYNPTKSQVESKRAKDTARQRRKRDHEKLSRRDTARDTIRESRRESESTSPPRAARPGPSRPVPAPYVSTKRLPGMSHQAVSEDIPPVIPEPTLEPKRKLRVAAAPKPAPDTKPTWDAYSAAYETRYGEKPIRDARVNTQILNFCKRVGIEEAPAIAVHYVKSNHGSYVGAGHDPGMLTVHAVKLRTEWRTGRVGTVHEAREADKKQGRGQAYRDQFADLKDKLVGKNGDQVTS